MSNYVCKLGDKSSHGGTIVTASGFDLNGIPIALDGDLCQCPIKGHGTCKMIASETTVTYQGKAVILVGDKTVCGAVLITGDSSCTVE